MRIRTVIVDRHPTGYSTDGGGLKMMVSLPAAPWEDEIRLPTAHSAKRAARGEFRCAFCKAQGAGQ